MTARPDSSAVRTALWRALHVQVDPPPHLLVDEIGLALAAPTAGWQRRPDMDPQATAKYRIGMVARTRFVEDTLAEERLGQYVLLGAGLDTFAQRALGLRGEIAVFEVDQPAHQSWKQRRLRELGYGIPDYHHLVPVDFESDGNWWQALLNNGFNPGAPALVSSSGVSMYITKEATTTTLRQLTALAPGSIVVMTFVLPFDLVDEPERLALGGAARGAQASGTPWISFYTPEEIVFIAKDAGFADARTLMSSEITERYLGEGTAPLRASSGEGVLIART